MRTLLSTKEVAAYLGVNEKMVYGLIAEKGLPGTKVTGKWLFPLDLVDAWMEQHTVNHPGNSGRLMMRDDLLVLAGSNDLLLGRALKLFQKINPGLSAAMADVGSMGGLKALAGGRCHVAASHLAQTTPESGPEFSPEKGEAGAVRGEEYNFAQAQEIFDAMPVVVNFCRREQTLLLPPGNPKNIRELKDLAKLGRDGKIATRGEGTGTRLRFERELANVGLNHAELTAGGEEPGTHMEMGLSILSGRAEAGPGIGAVAELLGLARLPFGYERFDLLIPKATFFHAPVQRFLNFLNGREFRELARALPGYDLSLSGQTLFPPSQDEGRGEE